MKHHTLLIRFWTCLFCLAFASQVAYAAEPPVSVDADKHLDLQVSGMTCNSCSNAIQSSVKQLAHVQSVVANHESGKVTVTCDQQCPEKGEVVSAIEKLGYTVNNK